MERSLQLACVVALREMLGRGHFSICTIDKLLKASNRPSMDANAYNTLSLLHCVDYGRMPQELRAELPQLIARVLGIAPEIIVEAEKPAATAPTGFARLLAAFK